MKAIARIKMIALVLLSFVTINGWSQTKQTRKVAPFTKLEINSAITVYLRHGDKSSVEIESNDDKLNKIITEVTNGKLKISRENNNNFNWDFWKSTKVTAYITMDKLEALEISGASIVKAEGEFKADNFELKLSGASKVDLDLTCKDKMNLSLSGASKADIKLSCSSVYAHLSGASNINVDGKTKNQKIEASGASNYRAFDLVGNNAEVNASGASNIEVNVGESIVGRASGASNVKYKGGAPKAELNTSGASNAKKIN